MKTYGRPTYLQAGQLQLVYENGAIRWIKLGNIEILRMIYSAVRDKNWGTVEPEIDSETIKKDVDSFEINLRVRYQSGPIRFISEYSIIGSNNRIVFKMKGTALNDFFKNRIGFCVLHPLSECIGKVAIITHLDGNKTGLRFPEQILPNQPATNIQSIFWMPASGIRAKVSFSGDIFEMEDQRNWTDASFKTYCTPLDLPFPVQIKKGETVEQVIEILVENDSVISQDLKKFSFAVSTNQFSPLPELGTSICSGKELLDKNEVKLLRQLPLKHLRVEVKPQSENFSADFKKVKIVSDLLEWPLFIVLYLSNNYESDYENFVRISKRLEISVSYLYVVGYNHLAFHLTDQLIGQLRKDFPDTKIGTGVNAYFAELNRTRPSAHKTDFVGFTVCPQIHAFDNTSIIENLTGQAEVINSAKNLYPGKSVFVSPVSLKQRINVVAISDEDESEPESRSLSTSVDLRQFSVFGAAWTLGSIKYLAQAGANLISYYETVGLKGLIRGTFESEKPGCAEVAPNGIYPIYTMLRELSGFTKVVHSRSSHPLIFDGILLQSKDRMKLLLFSFTSEDIEVRIESDLPLKIERDGKFEMPDCDSIRLKAGSLVVILCKI